MTCLSTPSDSAPPNRPPQCPSSGFASFPRLPPTPPRTPQCEPPLAPSVRQTPATRRSSALGSLVAPVSSAACSPHAGYGMSDKDHADSPTLQPSSTNYRGCGSGDDADRKSTRLNSSHVKISYAVFCL